MRRIRVALGTAFAIGISVLTYSSHTFADDSTGKGKARPGVKEIMVPLRTDQSQRNIERVLDALRELGPSATTDLLPQAFDADEVVARTARVRIVELGEAASGQVAKHISSNDAPKRLVAIELAGEMRAKSLNPLLWRLLHHDDADTRSAAAKSIGLIQDRRAILPLLALAYNDDEYEVRAEALAAIGRFGAQGSEAIEAVYELLRRVDRNGDELETLWMTDHICRALSKMGQKSLEVFGRVLSGSGQFSNGVKRRFLNEITRMRIDLRNKDARDLGVTLADLVESNDEELSTEAASALSYHANLVRFVEDRIRKVEKVAAGKRRLLIGICLVSMDATDVTGNRVLAESLSDGPVADKLRALMAVRWFTVAERGTVDAVQKLVNDSDREVRFHAIGAIEAVGTHEEFAPVLKSVIKNDSDNSVIREAKRVLEALDIKQNARQKKVK